MKLSFITKITISFCLLIVLFSLGIFLFQYRLAHKQKAETMEARLDDYADISYRYISQYGDDVESMDTLLNMLPPKLRLSIIDLKGDLLFDNRLGDDYQADNHAARPEIIAATKKGKGSDVRLSTSTNQEYLYYAKRLGDVFVRVALPYDVQVKEYFKPEMGFFYFLLLMFLLALLFIYSIGRRFGKTIQSLRNYSLAVNRKQEVEMPAFANDEIGEIGRQIAGDYKQLKESETRLHLEREKLLLHIRSSAEGVCFFTDEQQVDFYNGLFIQYLAVLSDDAASPAGILREEAFREVSDFLRHIDDNSFETFIEKHGRVFSVKVNVFDDDSFELVIHDVTGQTQSSRLKKEMTGNISHELRTPVTGIRGYLETILTGKLNAETQQDFIEKAYEQIILLSGLIRDMSLLSKLNEVPDSFSIQSVEIVKVIDKVKDDLALPLEEKDIVVYAKLSGGQTVKGNESLIYSIFRNLIDNVIHHAGESVTISISLYNSEKDFLYFSFADNGTGIQDEKHLIRLFERFYRASEGRSREDGGSGLGLSIVKNAIAFHGGTIVAKNRAGGGLEFIFSLPVG